MSCRAKPRGPRRCRRPQRGQPDDEAEHQQAAAQAEKPLDGPRVEDHFQEGPSAGLASPVAAPHWGQVSAPRSYSRRSRCRRVAKSFPSCRTPEDRVIPLSNAWARPGGGYHAQFSGSRGAGEKVCPARTASARVAAYPTPRGPPMIWTQNYDPLRLALAVHAGRRPADRAAAGPAGHRPGVGAPGGPGRPAVARCWPPIFVFVPPRGGRPGQRRRAGLGRRPCSRPPATGRRSGCSPSAGSCWRPSSSTTSPSRPASSRSSSIRSLSLSDDRRIQALLIAFCFGAFVEGAAGFGTPVAISAALLMGAGFRPLHAAGLALLANTSPVAFGALGTPILTLADVTGARRPRRSARWPAGSCRSSRCWCRSGWCG